MTSFSAIVREHDMVNGRLSEEVQQLVDELKQHLTELQLQNEELAEKQLELENARDRYADLYEFAPVGYLTIDVSGKIVSANRAAARLLRTKHVDMIGTPLSAYIDPDSQDELRRHFAAIFSDLPLQSCDLRLRDQTEDPLFARLESTRKGAEDICRTTITDITELKATQRKIRQFNRSLGDMIVSQMTRPKGESPRKDSTETFYLDQPFNLAIFNVVRVIILVLDHEGRIVTYNRYLEELTGRPLEEVQGRHWFSTFLPERDQKRITALFQRALAGTRTHANVNAILTRSGEERQIEWHDIEVRGADDEVVGLVAAGLDVTDRLHMEEDLRTQEARYRLMVDTATDAIVSHGRDGIISEFNPAAERMFGYTSEEAIGQNVNILMPSPYHEEHDQYIANYLRTGEPKIIGLVREMTALRKDSSVFPIEISVNELPEVGLFTGFMRDISERKSLQEQLLAIAEAEQREIGQVLHDDIGQELVSLHLYLQDVREDVESGQLPDQEKVKVIVTSIRRTLQKVKDLSHGLLPVKVDASELVGSLADLARMVSDQGDRVHCEFRHSGDVRVSSAIASQLYHIAQEAVNNAIQHSGAQRILVTLKNGREETELTVEDDGTGMHQNVRRFTGTGISIMKHRAGQIGAMLSIDPGTDGGTRVRCRIPGR